MPKIIDLTLPLGGEATVCPGHPPVILEPLHTHEVHGRSNTRMVFSIHTGTHVDVPYHFISDGLTVDQFPLERLMGMAVKVDLRGKAKANTPITVEDIRTAPGFPPGGLKDKIVILHSGWNEKMFYESNYYTSNPYLSSEAAQWLADQKIRALGLDFPQDKFEGPPKKGDFPIHRIILSHGIPFIEHLANLEKISVSEFQFIALPLKIHHGDGSPTRAVAILE
jgi:arylformamidase